jgi:hypothetical protein
MKNGVRSTTALHETAAFPFVIPSAVRDLRFSGPVVEMFLTHPGVNRIQTDEHMEPLSILIVARPTIPNDKSTMAPVIVDIPKRRLLLVA